MSIPAIIRGNGAREGLPDYVVKMLRRDQIGVYSGLVHRHFKVGSANQRIDPAWLDPDNAPAPWGIPCIDAEAEIADAHCLVKYRYEGADSPPDPDKAVYYELDTSMQEAKIEVHPSFAKLKLAYGWDDEERRFAETIGGSGSGAASDATSPINVVLGGIVHSTALSGGGTDAAPKKNPLFGVESWFSVSAVFRKSYALPEGDVPSSILRGIGTIVAAPPGIGQFRIPAGRRNWLKMAPKLTKRGNLVQITLEWALSHPGGWRKQIYAAGQLEEESGD